MGPDEMMTQFNKFQPTAGQTDPARQFKPPKNQTVSSRADTLKHRLSDDEKDFIQYLSAALPPIIGRAEVDRFLPGLVKPQTLAHADSAGLGPEMAWKIGRKVAYRTDSLLLWLVGRFGGVSRLVDANKFLNLADPSERKHARQ